MVEGIVWIIVQRNADCTGLKKAPSGDSDLPMRAFMDDYTAAGMQHQDVPSRRRFEKLLALAGIENLQAAADQAVRKMWEITDNYFACRAPSVEEERRIVEKTEKLIKGLKEKKQEIEKRKKITTKSGQEKAAAALATPLLRPDARAARFSEGPSSWDMMSEEERLYAEIGAVQEAVDTLGDQLDSLKQDSLHRCFDFVEYINDSEESMKIIMGPVYAERFRAFSIEDPYALCAGLFYLIDTDSDMPWLYFPGACLMVSVAGRLPWYKGSYFSELDSFWDGEKYSDIFHLDESDVKLQAHSRRNRWTGMGLTMSADTDGGITEMERTNLAQIVYQITGGVLPRDTDRYEDAVLIFRRFGITGKKLLSPLYQSITLLGEGQHNEFTTFHISIEDIEALLNAETAEEEVPEAETEDAESLLRTIRELKEQNAAFREACHEASKEARTARKKLEDHTRDWENERKELSGLREMIYMQSQGAAQEAPTAAEIEFPYAPAHRIVVFGGHDSWLRAIRPMLPDVRFIAPGILPNADVIRHADMVFIQSNALSHGDFYKLINVIRTYHVPIHYFSCASAAKCAEELARADREASEKETP